MISTIGAGELERELVVLVEVASASDVADHECAVPGPDNEFVARIVAAALEDGALHRGKDVSFEGAGA